MSECIKHEHVTGNMTLEDFIPYVIPSQDVLEYVREIGHHFSDWEIATLLYHSALNHQQRVFLQHKLSRTTKDSKLRVQLRKRRFWENAKADDFVRKNQGCFYAVMSEWDTVHEKICIGHFAEFKAAKACGMKEGQPFDIEKYQIMEAKEEPVKNFMSGDPIGRASFDKEGNLMDLENEALQNDWECDLETWDDSRYEDRYIYIPHPFQAGDLVRGVNQPEFCGMVITTDEDHRRIAKWKEKGLRVEYLDGALTILFLNECGELDHEHIMPQYLQRTNITDILAEKYNVLK